LPDISKINALAIGSVAKVDGLAKASILDIDGVAVPLTVSAPAAAYSVRLLGNAVGISSYTGLAMRVRRETAGGAGDDDEADIAFDSGVISLDSAISNASAGVTATTLGQFLNVGTVGGTTYTNPDSLTVTASCFVDEWKDQSGNANHATQATFGSQPQIHSGTVNTDLILENGKPALQGINANDTFLSVSFDLVDDFTMFSTFAQTASSMAWGGITNVIQKGYFWVQSDTRAWLQFDGEAGGGFIDFSGANMIGPQHLFYTRRFATTGVDGEIGIAFDGATVSTKSVTGSTNFGIRRIMGAYSSAYEFNGRFQEAIFYDSNQSSNRAGIESDINGFFSIYP
jgi:hypothetical protein